MNAIFKIILPVILVLSLCSCGKLKRKGQDVIHSVTQTLDEKADRLFPRFDPYETDSEHNRKRFREFLQVELTPDVKEIYCYNDDIGIDADYQFGFCCNDSTAERIITALQLTPDTTTTDYGFGMQTDFDWWDKSEIKKLPLFRWQGEHEHYRYFWYNPLTHQAYYFEFDM